MTTFDKVYAAVRLIPRGSVATYGQIAAAIGNKRLARVVGYALHVNPEPGVIPCHRVVKRDGEVSLSYMKGFERDTIMYEKGQEAERKNTERERQRADSAEKARDEAEKARMIAEEEKIEAQKKTAEALKRVAELEKILQCKTAEIK